MNFARTQAARAPARAPTPAQLNYGRLPLRFEANQGQTHAQARFLARGSGYALFLTETEAVLKLRSAADRAQNDESASASPITQSSHSLHSAVLRMRLVGAEPERRLQGLNELPGRSNYFIGDDPRAWRGEVAGFARVKYEQVYAGIDLVWHGDQQQLEHDFLVAPGAQPQRIRWQFNGARALRLAADGTLILQTGAGELRLLKPRAWQESGGQRQEVECRYRLLRGAQVGFAVGAYDHARPLVIDPVLLYSTYLGGTSSESAVGVAVDQTGSAYVVGTTFSTDFPGSSPLKQTKAANDQDAFILKLNPSGTALSYGAWLGGASFDYALAVAVDQEGNAYVTGYTFSNDFPTTPGALKTGSGAASNAFVTKLNGSGAALLYAALVGGNNAEISNGIAVDEDGKAYIAGSTQSLDLPATGVQTQRSSNGLFKSTNGASDWTASGTSLPVTTVQGLTLDSSNADTLYVSASTGVYKSTDGGAQWQLTGQGNPVTAPTGVLSVAVDPKTPLTIYATANFGLFKSTNGGQSYESKSLPASIINQVLIDPVTTTTLYAATGNGVFRSQNDGDTWVAVNVGLNRFGGGQAPRVNRLVFDPSNALTLYAATTFGAYKTTNGGAQWQMINNGLGQSGGAEVFTLAIDPVSPQTLYAGAANFNGGLYKTTDGGATWFLSNNGLSLPSSGQPFPLSVRALVIDPAMPMRLYAGTDSGVYKSTNGAASWEASNNGMPALITLALALDRLNPQTLYAGIAGGNDGFVAKLNATGTAFDWLTYLGGMTDDQARGIALDKNGNVYVAGGTTSNNFPTANALQASLAGSNDAFITKLNPAGSALVYSTYFGGASSDQARGLAVNDAGQVYFAGTTSSANFPVKNPLQTALGGISDAFVAKLNASGTASEYTTWLGGQGTENGVGIAIDDAGNAYVAGDTTSTNFPAVDAVQAQLKGPSDAFVAKLNPAGAALLYATYLGGDLSETANAIAVDGVGNAYVAGNTASPNFPVAGALQPALKAQTDAFLCKLGVEADLAVTQTPERNPVMVNDNLTITLAVNNRGPSPATGVTLTDSLPGSAGFVSATASQGSCAQTGGALTCNLGNLTVEASATITLVIKPSATGTINNTANVQAAEADSNQANNQTSIAVTVSSLPSIAGRIVDAMGQGLGGVNIALTGTLTQSALGSSNGVYQLADLQLGGDYTVTPTRAGYSFEPPARTFNNLTADATADFVATICAYTITPANQSFDAAGGTGTVNVTTMPRCLWTAVSDASWITITVGATGNGSGAVTFSVQPATTPRVGRLTVAGQTFVVYQGVDACDMPSFRTVGSPVFTDQFNSIVPKFIAGDFNGDGNTDLVTLSLGGGLGLPSSRFLSVLYGDKERGLVRAPENIPLNLAAFDLASGDFNGDGKPDLIVVLNNSSFWHLLLNNGQGGFSAPINFDVRQGTITQTSPPEVYTGDLNRDGKADLIYRVFGLSGEGGIWSSLSTGNGFAPAVSVDLNRFNIVAAGDLNNDGVLDLLTYNGAAINPELRTFLGDGMGGFRAPLATPLSRFVRTAALGDFNGDGKLDAVLALGPFEFSSVTEFDEINVLPGDGTGRFGMPSRTDSITKYSRLVVADFNNDAKLDVGLPDATQLRIMFGDGAGRLGDPQLVITSNVSRRLVVGDFNGDGRTDVAGIFLSDNGGFGWAFFNRCVVSATISGRIREQRTDALNWLADVPVKLVSGQTTQTKRTDKDGNYSFDALPVNASYTVTPELPGLEFTPPSQTIANLTSDRVVNFTAQRKLVAVNSASYAPVIAPQSIAAIFGPDMTKSTGSAEQLPLPLRLGDGTATLTDAANAERPLRFFFVSPNQINLLVPPGVAPGLGKLTFNSPGGNGTSFTTGTVQIENVAPGLYSADSSGRGVAAGVVLRIRSDGAQSFEPGAQLEAGRFVARPIDLSNPDEQVFLLLFGTGLRNRSATPPLAKIGGVDVPVLFAGAQGNLVGLDQVNVRLPHSLGNSVSGPGELDATITVDGKTSNAVRIAIKANPPRPATQTQPESAPSALPGSDLAVTHTAAHGRVAPGGRAVWIVTVKNLAGDTTANVPLTYTLPDTMTFVSCVADSGICAGSGNTRTASILPLKVGEARSLVVTTTVNDSLALGTTLNATAAIAPSHDDNNPNNNSATATISVVAANALFPPKANGKIVFVSDRAITGSTSPTGVYQINPDGTDELFLLGIGNYGSGGTPTWSPDGTRLAFNAEIPPLSSSLRFGVFVSKPDGSARIRIAEDPATHPFAQLSWSPDGTKVMYIGSPGSRIFIAHADGSGAASLPNSPTQVTDPNWSPDGTQMAFTKDRKIWVMNLDGTGQRVVSQDLGFNNEYYGPRWSPDGTRLIFTRRTNNTYQAYLVNADGTGFARALNVSSAEAPAWSPDGAKIVYLLQNSLYTADLYFGNPTPVTRNPWYQFAPHWQPLPTATPPPATPRTFTISGQARLPNGTSALGTMRLTGSVNAVIGSGETTENDGGAFSLVRLPAGGTYTLTPQARGYTFTPTSRTYINLSADVTDADFIAATSPPKVSGRVTDQSGAPLVGVSVRIGAAPSQMTETDANGYYEFTGLSAGASYTVMVSSQTASDHFDPAYVTYAALDGDRTADFVGSRALLGLTAQVTNTATAALREKARQAYGQLPLSFEANLGQFAAPVQFAARGTGYLLWLTPAEAVLQLQSSDVSSSSTALRQLPPSLRLRFMGAEPTALTGLEPTATKSHYFTGNEERRWRANVSHFARVKAAEIYPGVDIVWYGRQRELEYDLVLKPGARAERIRLAIAGAKALRLAADGAVEMRVAGASEKAADLVLRWLPPVAWQEIGGERRPVRCAYRLHAHNELTFALGAYDRARLLVIDPVLSYATLLGGTGLDQALAVTLDDEGNAYVAGATNSADFPGATAIQATRGGQDDAFVAKLNPTGSALVWATGLGGSEQDEARALALDGNGDVLLTGITGSRNFPTVRPVQATNNSQAAAWSDAFITRLSADGQGLIHSTYLGGGDNDTANDIALDAAGNVYVTGKTRSADFPVVSGLTVNPVNNGTEQAFVTKLNAGGAWWDYSTLLGGDDGADSGEGIAADAAGNAYVVGQTQATNFPTTPGALRRTGPRDAFVTKLAVSADLALAITDLLDPVQLNGNLSYTLTVTNQGPDVATNVVVTDTLPSGVTFISATASQGACMGPGPIVCNLGNLAGLARATITLVVRPTVIGTITNRATVTSATVDPDTNNNSATQETRVVTLPSIFGRVIGANGAALGGVTITLTGGQQPVVVTTGSDGSYQFAELAGGANYTVTPTAMGTAFNPPSRTFNNLTADQRTDFSAVTCAFTLSVTTQTFAATGSAGSVTLAAPDPQCVWTARSNAGWIRLNNANGDGVVSGAGSATISFTVEPTVDSRSGTLTIGGNTFMVLQQFYPCATVNFPSANVTPAFVQGGVLRARAADFNRDGLPDLALRTGGTNNQTGQFFAALQVLLARSEGGYAAAQNALIFTGNQPSITDFRVGDLNGDGFPDLAAAGGIGASYRLWLVFNNGAGGGFTAPREIALTSQPLSLALGDYDNDNRPDIIVGTAVGEQPLLYLANQGDGNFAAPRALPAATPVSTVTGIEPADIDGDGKLDLFAFRGSQEVAIYKGDGAGAFALQPDLIRDSRNGRAIGDFNGDGHPDFAASNFNELRIWLNDGTGRFPSSMSLPLRFPYTANPGNLLAADFSGDGRSDLLLLTSNSTSGASEGLLLLLATGGGNFSAPVNYLAYVNGRGGPLPTVIGDFTRDGLPDLLLFDYNSINVTSSLITVATQPGGTLALPRGYIFSGNQGNTQSTSSPLAPADFNGDGLLDLAATRTSGGSVGILYGNGRGEFSQPVDVRIAPNDDTANFVLARDFNRDGRPDLAVLRASANELRLLLNDGRGGFTAGAALSVRASFNQLEAGDFNNDGALDLVARSASDTGLTVFINNGQAAFTPVGVPGFLPDGERFTVGDFNGDGNSDLVFSESGSGGRRLNLALGDGRGAFAAPRSLPLESSLQALTAADVNHDGRADLLYTLFSANQLVVLLGNRDGTFAAPRTTPLGLEVRYLAVADVNGDGRADVLAPGTANFVGALLILLGRGDGMWEAPVRVNAFDAPLHVTPGDFDNDGAVDLAVARQSSVIGGVLLNRTLCAAAGMLVTTSAASYARFQAAPESIAALFGAHLATATQAADSIPLPTQLAGASVRIRDQQGTERSAPLFFVSPAQINWQVPAGLAPGVATVSVTNGNDVVATGTLTLAPVAPGLFTANATGEGLAAAVVVRVQADGAQLFEPVARLEDNRFVPVPIDLSDPSEQVFLVLFGTGLRGRSAPENVKANFGGIPSTPVYVGPTPGLIGLDQINLPLPRELADSGEINVEVTVDGRAANPVRISVR